MPAIYKDDLEMGNGGMGIEPTLFHVLGVYVYQLTYPPSPLFGAPAGSRTPARNLIRVVLYQLSYRRLKWRGVGGSNSWPLS